MPRDPNIPDAFDVFTLVLLRRPDDAPDLSESELDALEVFEWWVSAGTLALPGAAGAVGERRSMFDD